MALIPLAANGDSAVVNLRDFYQHERNISYDIVGNLVGDVTIEGSFKEEPASDADYILIQTITVSSARTSAPKVDPGGYVNVRFRVSSYTSGTSTLETRVF